MSTFQFNSRETYIEYVKQWRTNYAELSQSIREANAQVKILNRDMSLGYTGPKWTALTNMQSRRLSLISKARSALEERIESKKLATIQYNQQTV
jgi:hypothetical protein